MGGTLRCAVICNVVGVSNERLLPSHVNTCGRHRTDCNKVLVRCDMIAGEVHSTQKDPVTAESHVQVNVGELHRISHDCRSMALTCVH